MKLIRNLHSIAENFQSVATIGNFDGVHQGHQQLLQRLIKQGALHHLPACVITFEPQPNEFFGKNAAPARLTKFREKVQLLQRYSMDGLICLRFNKQLADLKAEEFIQKILVKALGVKHLIVGDDFRFGYQRQGDAALLRVLGQNYGFQTEVMPTFSVDGSRVSSSRIREALAKGDLELAKKLLGRPYCLSGRVSYGNQLGRKLGFPTANIHLNRKVVPVSGIFAVKIFNLADKPLYGVANIGNRPAVGGGRTLLEVYIFDFNEVIYGQAIQVELVKKLREEQHFDSLEALRQQIILDAEEARQLFK